MKKKHQKKLPKLESWMKPIAKARVSGDSSWWPNVRVEPKLWSRLVQEATFRATSAGARPSIRKLVGKIIADWLDENEGK